jgi:hypothetical protein
MNDAEPKAEEEMYKDDDESRITQWVEDYSRGASWMINHGLHQAAFGFL